MLNYPFCAVDAKAAAEIAIASQTINNQTINKKSKKSSPD